MSSLVEVIIGGACNDSKYKATWHLPRALLCQKSAFFRYACNLNPASPKTSRVTLRYDDPDTFELFVEWLETDSYEKRNHFVTWSDSHIEQKRSLDTASREELIPWEWKACICAWVLGHRLCAPGFQNFAMKKVYEIYWTNRLESGEMDNGSIVYVVLNTVRSSKLRLLFANCASRWIKKRKQEGSEIIFDENSPVFSLMAAVATEDYGERPTYLRKYLEPEEMKEGAQRKERADVVASAKKRRRM